MRVLITGGAGFIGSHLAHALAARGDQVVVLDDLSSGHLSNLADVPAEVHVGSVLHEASLQEVMSGVDYVLHHAARPALEESVKDPGRSFQANVRGTLNVLEAARQAGVRRVVYAASSSAYGDPRLLPTPEDAPLQPVTPYAAFKLHGELLCQSWYRTFGLETVCLRYFNIFGPRQDPNSPYAAVVPRFIQAVLRGESPTVFGDGRQTRDFCYVGNVVEANLRALVSVEAPGRVYNIGTGTPTSLLGLIDLIGEFMGFSVQPVFGPAREGDARASVACITRAYHDLGYEARVRVSEGLRETVEWYRRQFESGSPGFNVTQPD